MTLVHHLENGLFLDLSARFLGLFTHDPSVRLARGLLSWLPASGGSTEGKVEVSLRTRCREEVCVRGGPQLVHLQEFLVGLVLNEAAIRGFFLDRRDWDVHFYVTFRRAYDLHLHLEMVRKAPIHSERAFLVHF